MSNSARILSLGQLCAQFSFNVMVAALFMTFGVRPRLCFCMGLPLTLCSALARLRFMSLKQWLTFMRSTPMTLDDFAAATVQSAWRGVMSRARTRTLLEQKVLNNLANSKCKSNSTIAATASAAVRVTAQAFSSNRTAAPAARHRRLKPKRNSNVDVFVRQRMQRTDADSSTGLGGLGGHGVTSQPVSTSSRSQTSPVASPAASSLTSLQPLTPPDAVRNWKTGRHILRQARPESAKITLQPAG